MSGFTRKNTDKNAQTVEKWCVHLNKGERKNSGGFYFD